MVVDWSDPNGWKNAQAEKAANDKTAIDNWNKATAAKNQTASERAKAEIMPTRPNYGAISKNGVLGDQYKLGLSDQLTPDVQNSLSGINLNTQGLEALRGEALRTGPSAWANLMTQNQGVDEAKLRDQNMAKSASQSGSAWNQLAMRGGVGGGARERLATSAAGTANMAGQDIARAGSQQRLGIGTQDETNRLGILSQLPGMEVNSLNPAFQKATMMGQAKQFDINNNTATNKFNLGNVISDVQGKNSFDLNKYTEQMKTWAANRQADAQENSGK